MQMVTGTRHHLEVSGVEAKSAAMQLIRTFIGMQLGFTSTRQREASAGNAVCATANELWLFR
jgi:hypothetical protein